MADLIQTVARVGQFASLPTGWDYGRGGSSTVATCARARTLLTTLYALGLRRFDTAPGKKGGITVAAIKSEGNEIEIHCGPHGTYDLYASHNGNDLIDLENVGFLHLLEELRGIGWLSTKSSTWSTPNVICLTWDDSQVSPLRIHRTVQAYPSFVCNAPSKRAEASVRTYNSTLEPVSVGTRRFIGDSDTRNLQLA